MPADPVDISKFTTDGIVITSDDPAIAAAHPDAEDRGDSEIEMFYVSEADGQAMLDERFAILSKLDPANEGIEVSDSLGLGITVPLTPSVPCFRVVDDRRGIDAVARTRAFAYEMGTDRFSIEVLE